MTKYGRYIASSFGEIRCCDEQTQVITDPANPTITYAWRAVNSSKTCVLDGNGNRTGYAHINTLEKYDVSTGVATGDTKPNISIDSDYVPDFIDLSNCPLSPPVEQLSTLDITNHVMGNLTYLVHSDGVHTYHFNNVPNNGHQTKSILDGLYTLVRIGANDIGGVTNSDRAIVTVNGISQPCNGSPIDFINVVAPMVILLDVNP